MFGLIFHVVFEVVGCVSFNLLLCSNVWIDIIVLVFGCIFVCLLICSIFGLMLSNLYVVVWITLFICLGFVDCCIVFG
jgi:hypothetical protein